MFISLEILRLQILDRSRLGFVVVRLRSSQDTRASSIWFILLRVTLHRYSTIHWWLQAVALERENPNVLTPMLLKTLTTPSI
jgi:hypothetical protein